MAKASTPSAAAAPAKKAPARRRAPAAKATAKTVSKLADDVAKPTASRAEAVKEQVSSAARTAGDKARDYANTGKDKATDALAGLSGFVEELAKSVDDKIGTQYGDYARKAAGAVSGVADSLKGKDVDDLVEDTRKFIREKPAVAIGAAAAVGFVLMRLMKAGSNGKDA